MCIRDRPNTATTLYVYTPVSSFEMIQTCEIQNNMNITFTTTGVNAKSAKARAGGEGVFTGRRNAKVIEASTNLYSFYNFQLTDGEMCIRDSYYIYQYQGFLNPLATYHLRKVIDHIADLFQY